MSILPNSSKEPNVPPCFDKDWRDNLGDTCYNGVCAPTIDIVYTWVNGSDPKQIEGLLAILSLSNFSELRKVKDRALELGNLTGCELFLHSLQFSLAKVQQYSRSRN